MHFILTAFNKYRRQESASKMFLSLTWLQRKSMFLMITIQIKLMLLPSATECFWLTEPEPSCWSPHGSNTYVSSNKEIASIPLSIISVKAVVIICEDTTFRNWPGPARTVLVRKGRDPTTSDSEKFQQIDTRNAEVSFCTRKPLKNKRVLQLLLTWAIMSSKQRLTVLRRKAVCEFARFSLIFPTLFDANLLEIFVQFKLVWLWTQ